tara:strand:- start:177 stop:1175 length:999 start_codon:yes stop_codon:yes gene_type:complete
MLIQKIIGINIKVKNDNDEYEDFDVDTFEKNRNISDYSYGEEIRKKLFKIKETNKLPENEKTQYTVEDCENISNLRDSYNSLKKQDKLYGEKSPTYDKVKNEIIKDYTKQFKTKLDKISNKVIDEAEIFTKDIFAEDQSYNYLIKKCSERMKQLDPKSFLGLQSEINRINADIKDTNTAANDTSNQGHMKILKDRLVELHELKQKAENFGNHKFKTDSEDNKIYRGAEKTDALYQDAEAKRIKSDRELTRLDTAVEDFEMLDKSNLTDAEIEKKQAGLQKGRAEAEARAKAAEKKATKANQDAQAKAAEAQKTVVKGVVASALNNAVKKKKK